MSIRKKNAEPPRQKKNRPAGPSIPATVDVDVPLMIGEERMHIDREEDDNIAFMAEVVDPR